jgi:autophagy-related protein 18
VKMNRQRLIVCVEDGIYIHNVRTMEMQHKVEETPPNRRGVVALSTNETNCYFAYPGSAREGSVLIFDAMNFQNVTTILAHNGLLAAMAFNQSGNLLATASEKGTVIRVFSIPSGVRVMEFRRGLARFAMISSLTFSLDDLFLVASSNTETVHIFRLEAKRDGDSAQGSDIYYQGSGGVSISRKRSGSEAVSGSSPSDSSFPGGSMTGTATDLVLTHASSGGWLDWIGGTIKQTASFLPSQFSEIITQDRAFAFAHLSPGSSDVQKIAAMVYHNRLPRLLVASMDGYLNVFAVDPVNGGEAQLLKTINLLSPRENQDVSSGGIAMNNPSHSHRRYRCESNSSVESSGNFPQVSSSPHKFSSTHKMMEDEEASLNTFGADDNISHFQSYPTDDRSCSFINEGIDNLRLQDHAEFPSLPKKT